MSEINFCHTKEQLNHLGEVVTGKTNGSPSGPDISTSTLPYTGQVRKTLTALEAEYTSAIQAAGGEALNGGVWDAGQTFTAYNQYMVYNGVPYKPKATTALPYGPTGATPDFNSVQPYVQISSGDVSNINLISNSRFEVAGSVANAPDATPRSYNINDELFHGFKALGALTGVTYVSGVLNGAGQLYIDVVKTQKMQQSTSGVTASLAGADGKPLTSGVSIFDNGSSYRVIFNISGVSSVKLEQGTVATGHSTADFNIDDMDYRRVTSFKSDASNTAIDNMIAGKIGGSSLVNHVVGNLYIALGGLFECVSTPVSSLSDFKQVTPVRFDSTELLISGSVSSTALSLGLLIETYSYRPQGEKIASVWVSSGTQSTPSQSPSQTSDLSITDSGGNVYVLNNYLRPTQFGAYLDGVNSDTVLFEKITNANKLKGLRPSDSIKLESLNITADDVVLLGNGAKITSGEINISGNNPEVSGFVFDYSNVDSGVYVIKFTNSLGYKVFGNTFRNIQNQYPVYPSGSDGSVESNRFLDTWFAIQNVPASDGGLVNKTITIKSNQFKRQVGTSVNLISEGGNPAGWQESASAFESVICSNNLFMDTATYPFTYRGWNCTVSGNVFINCEAVTFQGGDFTVSGNIVKSSTTVGLDFGNCTNSSCIGNVVEFSKWAGIEINSCEKLSVVGNTLRSNSIVTPPSSKYAGGIWVHGVGDTTVPPRACKDIMIIGNNISSGTSTTQRYGITIENSDSQVHIANNLVQASGTVANIVSESANVSIIGNMDNFSATNQQIQHVGTFTPISLNPPT